jgi:hypothetical protein
MAERRQNKRYREEEEDREDPSKAAKDTHVAKLSE